MVKDELVFISLLGIFFLFILSFIYNFYLNKKIYRLLETIGEIVAITAEFPAPRVKKVSKTEGTMKKLLKQGMALEKTK